MSKKDAVVKETNKRYIQLTIFLALAFLGWIIPPAYGLTSEGVKMLLKYGRAFWHFS